MHLFLSFSSSFFSLSFVVSFFEVAFVFSWTLFGPVLSSQAGLPSRKKLSFSSRKLRFLKSLRSRADDGLENVLGVSWAPLGDSWGPVGGDVGASWRLLAGLLASSLLHVFFEVVLFSSSKVLGTTSVSTTDLPSLKNKHVS